MVLQFEFALQDREFAQDLGRVAPQVVIDEQADNVRQSRSKIIL